MIATFTAPPLLAVAALSVSAAYGEHKIPPRNLRGLEQYEVCHYMDEVRREEAGKEPRPESFETRTGTDLQDMLEHHNGVWFSTMPHSCEYACETRIEDLCTKHDGVSLCAECKFDENGKGTCAYGACTDVWSPEETAELIMSVCHFSDTDTDLEEEDPSFETVAGTIVEIQDGGKWTGSIPGTCEERCDDDESVELLCPLRIEGKEECGPRCVFDEYGVGGCEYVNCPKPLEVTIAELSAKEEEEGEGDTTGGGPMVLRRICHRDVHSNTGTFYTMYVKESRVLLPGWEFWGSCEGYCGDEERAPELEEICPQGNNAECEAVDAPDGDGIMTTDRGYTVWSCNYNNS